MIDGAGIKYHDGNCSPSSATKRCYRQPCYLIPIHVEIAMLGANRDDALHVRWTGFGKLIRTSRKKVLEAKWCCVNQHPKRFLARIPERMHGAPRGPVRNIVSSVGM
jgi:hypothetical protein